MSSGFLKNVIYKIYLQIKWKCSRGVLFKTLDSGLVLSEFELRSCHYVHFRTNSFGEKYESPCHPSYRLNSTTTSRSRGRPEDSLFNSYYNKVLGRELLLFQDFTLDPYLIILSVKQGSIKYHF